MSVRLAAHWTATTLIAAIASTLAAIPFTGAAASYAAIVAAAGVCMAGIALAPTTSRKGRRS